MDESPVSMRATRSAQPLRDGFAQDRRIRLEYLRIL
jgi:hypothetical protein